MHADLQIQTQVLAPPRARAISALSVIAALLVFAFGWYWETTFSIVSIWQRSETFAHGFLVVPIFAYLVWLRRRELALIPMRPCAPALAGLAAAGLAWLVGETGSVVSLSQFAVASMVPIAIWAVLGTRVVKELAFPLAFLFFTVPFGDFLVPTLIDRTADVTVFALQATGVPVYRDGNQFQIPTGSWSVVEACSGIRYLIASLMAGILFAYLSYTSLRRRLIFIGFSILVPIVANWLRAYMIVMLGHLSGNRIAAGVDHLVYGWVFFGVVMAVLFFVGSRWQEAPSSPSRSPVASAGAGGLAVDGRSIATALAAFALIAAWKPVHAALEATGPQGAPALARVHGANGWSGVGKRIAPWRPHFVNPAAERVEGFEKGGRRVDLYLSYYRAQTQGTELIGWHNQLVASGEKHWRKTASGEREVQLAGAPLRVRTAEVVGPGVRLLVWQWYWVNGRLTSSNYLAKGYATLDRLFGRGDDAAAVVIYAPMSDSRDERAAEALAMFAADMAPSIEQRLAAVRGR